MAVLKFSSTAELILKNDARRVDVHVRNDDGTALAPASLTLTVTDLGDTVIHKDGYPSLTLTGTVTVTAASTAVTGTGTKFQTELVAGDTVTIAAEAKIVDRVLSDTQLLLTTAHTAGASGATATKTTRIVNSGTGDFYINWGDLGAPANATTQTETNAAEHQLFVWKATLSGGAEQLTAVQDVKVVSAKTLSLLTPLRVLIDKSRKQVSSDPDDECFLGYTDADLLQYLEQGLQMINAEQPYPTFCTLDDFPSHLFGHVLFEAALIAGVISQNLFAIDTDIPSYSDQGNSFVIQHGPQLAAFLNQITARLDKMIPKMKMHFVRTGALHVQAGPNYRLQQLIQAAPNGALFRNMYFRSS